MARKLDRFPSAAAARYPRDEFLDGDIWELVPGVDFKSRPSTFIANARSQAKRRGGTLRTRTLHDGNGNGNGTSIAIQFRRTS